jgi:hypothetical protein
MKVIEVIMRAILPMVFIFGVLPRVVKIIKEVLFDDDIEEDIKKIKRQMRPKPKPRPTINTRNLVGHRNPPPPPKSRFEGYVKTTVKDGKIEYGEPLVKPTKKKHFTKGVDPDFL